MKPLSALSYLPAILVALMSEPAHSQLRSYGSWLYSESNKYPLEGRDHFNPKQPGLPRTMTIVNGSNDVLWTPSEPLYNAAVGFVDILKEAYPRPANHSIVINTRIQAVPASGLSNLRTFHFNLGYYAYEVERTGQLKKNYSLHSSLTSESRGYFYINSLPFGPFRNDKLSSRTIKDENGKEKKVVRKSGVIYNIPPALDGFDSFVARPEVQLLISAERARIQLANFPKNQFLFQKVNRLSGTENGDPIWHIANIAVLTKNSRLPYVTITREKFFEVVAEVLNDEMELFANHRKEQEEKLAAFAAVREYYKSSLQEPAILRPDSPLLSASMHDYTVAKGHNSPEKIRRNIANIFAADATQGISLMQLDRSLLATVPEHGIRAIAIQWSETLRTQSNAALGACQLETDDKDFGVMSYSVRPQPVHSDCEHSFNYAIRHKLDWKKLEGLMQR